MKGHRKIENLLLEHGQMKDKTNFETILSTAMKNRKFAIVEQLLENKYFIKEKSSSEIYETLFLINHVIWVRNCRKIRLF